MATKTINYTSLVNSRTPTTGYMTIGYSSGGTNNDADVTFPALGVTGVISEVRLYYAWDNSAAGEGFQAATTHKAGSNTYSISGSSGSGSVVLTSGYSNTAAWSINICGAVATNSTSKGYYKSATYLYVIVTYTPYTACGAPTACSVNATLAEGNVTLSWSGATNGTNNTISSYEIQYSESSDNTTWGSWNALTTVTTTATSGSVSVAPPSTRGYYRRFQVRTRGTAGASYYSGWKISTNSVRRNTVPNPPTTAIASPATYNDETVTLTWSGASGGTSAIKGYKISSRTSSDNSSWSSWTVLATLTLSASSGSYSPDVTRTPGIYTQFSISTIDALDVYSTEKVSNSIYCSITACGSPTSCYVSATLSEGNVTLLWSGASNGAGNTIMSYEIQYSDSSDGSTWGSWMALTTVSSTSTSGSLSVSPPSTRGDYRRFQVRTQGTAGESFYSGWAVSSNNVRKNTLPTAPTSFVALPQIYEVNLVTLTWNGVVPGTSAIKQYVIQQSTSVDGITWSAYEALATIVSSATSGNYQTSASSVAGTYTRYRISVTDVLDAVSPYVVSNQVKKNSPPSTPAITAPTAGSSTYNTTPRFLITTGVDADGQLQMAGVKIGTSAWQDSLNDAEFFSVNGCLGNNVATIYKAGVMATGIKSVAFRSVDYGVESSSPEVTRSFTVLQSPFEAIIANETKVKAVHIQELRTAINNIRRYYGMATINWSEELISGKTYVRNWPNHITEMRKAIDSVIVLINGFDTSQTFDVPTVTWLPIGTGRPKADVMQQLYDLVLTL